MTPLQAAERLAPVGFRLIPVPFGSKKPGRTGWQNERWSADDLPRKFNGARQNIGVLCGEPSGGLVDVDLDSQEAIDAAGVLLPPTGRVGGRARRPRSHHWFRTDHPPHKTKQFLDPVRLAHGESEERAMLLELRSTGGHTLVYGQHPEGDIYQWDVEGEPATISTTDLQRTVALMASAALMGRYWAGAGGRHMIALAWAGFFLSNDLSYAETELLIKGACAVAGDREVDDRVAGVRTTRERLDAGEPATGGATLIKLFGGDDGRRVLDALTDWLGLTRRWQAVTTGVGAGVGTTTQDRGKETQATTIVRLADELFTFHTSEAGEPFAVAKDGPPIARMLRGGRESLRATLAQRFAATHDRAPSSGALADALLVIEGRCLTSDRVPLHLRVVRVGTEVIVDLGRADGQAVIVGPGSWTTGPTPTGIVWRRTELTGELPLPERGASLETLRDVLNVTDTGWLFIRGALVAALLADVPSPVVLFRGPQGSGKSSAARTFTMLIDPSAAPLRAAPDRPDGWQVAAAGARVVSLDNVSVIQPWLSDAICRACTGDGLVKRRLYSDDSLVVLAYRRVVTLTAIDTGALRGDLADRLLPVELERIPPDRRRLDAGLNAAFTAGQAGWLGSLFDCLASALTILPDVRLSAWPRMADFGRVLAAVDAVTGTDGFARYMQVGEQLAGEVIEGDTVAATVVAWMAGQERWEGTAGELLTLLSPERPPKGWPATAHHLTGRLKRASEALRMVGVDVSFRRDKYARIVVIERVGEQASSASSASSEADPGSIPGDAGDDAGGADDAQRHPSASSAMGGAQIQDLPPSDLDDADDAGDADLRTDFPGDSVPADPLADARVQLLERAETAGFPSLDLPDGRRLHDCASCEQVVMQADVAGLTEVLDALEGQGTALEDEAGDDGEDARVPDRGTPPMPRTCSACGGSLNGAHACPSCRLRWCWWCGEPASYDRGVCGDCDAAQKRR